MKPLRDIYNPTRTAKIKKKTNHSINLSKNVEQLGLNAVEQGVNWYNHFRKLSISTKTEIPPSTEMWTYAKQSHIQDTRIFIALLFVIAKSWKIMVCSYNVTVHSNENEQTTATRNRDKPQKHNFKCNYIQNTTCYMILKNHSKRGKINL